MSRPIKHKQQELEYGTNFHFVKNRLFLNFTTIEETKKLSDLINIESDWLEYIYFNIKSEKYINEIENFINNNPKYILYVTNLNLPNLNLYGFDRFEGKLYNHIDKSYFFVNKKCLK